MKKKGFTLIELLLVISILAVLFTLGTVVYNSFVRKDALLLEARKIESLVNEARAKTVAGFSLGGTQALNFGVYFMADQYFLFTGTSYNPGTQSNQKFTLPATVSISQISLPGQSIIFKKITGEVLNYNASQNYLVLSGKNSSDKQKISINQLGMIKIEKQ